MGVCEIGTRPTNVQQVPANTEVEVGKIYGADIYGEVWSCLPSGVFEEKMAEQWWKKIQEKGDIPLYVKVEARVIDYDFGKIMVTYKYQVNITVFARKQSPGSPIHLVIAAIAALIFAVGWLIDRVDEWRYNTWYYETYGKPPEKGKEGLLAGLGALLLLIIILYALSKRR